MRKALGVVGIFAILCAAFGLFYNFNSFRSFAQYNPEHDLKAPYFYPVFYTMSGICVACYVLLFLCGIQLIRGRLNWIPVFIGVQIFEVAYFFSIVFVALISLAAPKFSTSLAAATGVANGGLMVQFLILFPLWGTMVALFAKRKLETAT